MQKPFGFMKSYYVKETIELKQPSSNAGPSVQQQLTQFDHYIAEVQPAEKAVEQKFDQVASNIAMKIGVKEIPWY